jgi:outer membrane protein assembly factor BamB
MAEKNECTRFQPLVVAMVGVLAATLVVLGTTPQVLGAKTKDSVRWTKEELAKLSQNQPKPLWQTGLKGQETDFIQFLSPDRVLVGTLETSRSGWGLKEKEVMLLNATTGEAVWTSPRSSFGSRLMVLATDPFIVLQGSKEIGAISPKDGTLIWEQPWPGGRSSPLPDGNRIVLFSLKKDTLSLSAVNLKDGTASWSASAEKNPKAKVVALGAKAVGGVVILSLMEEVRDAQSGDKPTRRRAKGIGGFPMTDVVAFADKSGHQLWKRTFGLADVVVLGDDLYFLDGTSVTKADPATGNQVWRQEFPGAAVRNLTMSGGSAYVLLREGGSDGSSDAIQAVERQAGKPLWKCSLPEPVQSAMVIEGDRTYVTTASQLIAVDASRKAIAWKAAIPPNLQGRRLLPDKLRVTDDRIVLAREIGVMGVEKRDGKLLFAESIADGAPFTNDYAKQTLAQALEGATPVQQRPEAHAKLTDADQVDTSMRSYRYALMAQVNQQSFYSRASDSLAATANQNWLKVHQDERLGIDSSQDLAVAELASPVEANLALVMAGAALGQSIAQARIDGIREGRVSVMTAEMTQTLQTHVNSLQNDFYIRPRYQQNRGWSLVLVDLKTGKRAELLLSPDNQPLAQYAPNLPAFAVDPSGSRILAKGLGLDPARYDTYERRGVFNPAARYFAAFRGEMWSIPYPSILAFDLASLPSGQKPENQRSVAKPVSADKKALNDQLIQAAFQNDLETVKKALNDGADVNATDEYGRTALMLAAESLSVYGKKDIIEALVQHGADVSLKDPHGWTATDHFALIPPRARIKSGVVKSVRLLVKEGKEESEEESVEESKEEP